MFYCVGGMFILLVAFISYKQVFCALYVVLHGHGIVRMTSFVCCVGGGMMIMLRLIRWMRLWITFLVWLWIKLKHAFPALPK